MIPNPDEDTKLDSREIVYHKIAYVLNLACLNPEFPVVWYTLDTAPARPPLAFNTTDWQFFRFHGIMVMLFFE